MIEIGICCVYKYLVRGFGFGGLVPLVRGHHALWGGVATKSDFINLWIRANLFAG
jgi:hypothetical protein